MATTSEADKPVKTKAASLSRSPKYYEADGALRAYANRSFIVAAIAVLTAVAAVIGMIVVRIQPPTVIRVLPSGQATVVSPNGTLRHSLNPVALRQERAADAPTQFEKNAFVRTFLENYLNYDQYTIDTDWSNAANMMTANLQTSFLEDLRKHNTVGKYKKEHIRSVFKLTQLQQDPTDPLAYMAYGVRTVHRFAGGDTEQVVQIVESYRVNLAEFKRSDLNPSGLLIDGVTESQIHAQKQTVASFGANDGGGENQ